MLRMESESGWWLITHQDHARLAGDFAKAWGNEQFCKPEPRARVLHGIASHDDGWVVRDQHPSVTRQGKPSAFSIELVGKYSAFEEIDLADYLAVRERAVRIIAEADPYAGLLIAMHTYNLLTEHADRATIEPDDLPLLDAFLEKQLAYQTDLRLAIAQDETLSSVENDARTIEGHFRLLQACDNLSLLTCVAYDKPANLLHALPTNDRGDTEVQVEVLAPRHFRLKPWPFEEPEISFQFPARHVDGKVFSGAAELGESFFAAPLEAVTVRLRST